MVSFRNIISELKGMGLDRSEQVYFNEFINLLYRRDLLSHEISAHTDFIKSNAEYIESLEENRIKNGGKFTIVVHLKDAYSELIAINRNVGFTKSHKTRKLIEEYLSFNHQEKIIDGSKKVVYIIDDKYKYQKTIVVAEMALNREAKDYSPYIDKTLFHCVEDTFRRPLVFLSSLEKAMIVFHEAR